MLVNAKFVDNYGEKKKEPVLAPFMMLDENGKFIRYR